MGLIISIVQYFLNLKQDLTKDKPYNGDGYEQLMLIGTNDDDFRDRITAMNRICHEFASVFHQFDVQVVQANGLRTIVKITDRFFIKIAQVLRNNHLKLNNLSLWRRLMVWRRQPSPSSSVAISQDIRNATDIMRQVLEFTKLIKSRSVFEVDFLQENCFLFNKEKMISFYELDIFWLPQRQQGIPTTALTNCLMLHRPHLKAISHHHRMTTYYDVLWKANVKDIRDSSVLSHLFRKSTQKVVQLENGVNQVTSEFNLFQRWSIKIDNHQMSYVVLLEENQRRSISYVSHCKGKPNGQVVLFVHGGGFFGLPASVHALFLSKWSQMLQGVTFICPEYGLAPEHKFPAAVQDILDCYIHLTSPDSNVENDIGFYPSKVVVVGDSAGGSISVALVVSLNMCRHPLPTELLLTNPVITSSLTHHQPSHALIPIDPLICFSEYMLSADSYAPGNTTDSCQTPSWYVRPTTASRSYEIDQYTKRNKLFNVILNDFSDISKRVRLKVMAAEFDPLIDHSMDLVRKWSPDKVTLTVVREVSHGFIFLWRHSPEADRATKDLIDTIFNWLNQ